MYTNQQNKIYWQLNWFHQEKNTTEEINQNKKDISQILSEHEFKFSTVFLYPDKETEYFWYNYFLNKIKNKNEMFIKK